MTQTAAIVFCLLIAGLGVFQFALAMGAPLGRYAWGGQTSGRLPPGLRTGSAISILVYTVFALIMLERASLVDMTPGEGAVRIAAWAVIGLLAAGCVMNAISRSPHERYVMTPLCLALAACALIVARS